MTNPTEEKLMKPKLIWKGTIRDAIREGRLTQEQLDEWNRIDEEGESYNLSFKHGKQAREKEILEMIDEISKLRLYRSKSCQLLSRRIKSKITGEKLK